MHSHVIFGLKLFSTFNAKFNTFATFTADVWKCFSTLSTSTCTHMSYLVLSFLLHSVHCSVTSSHSLQMFGNAFPHYYIKRIFFTLIIDSIFQHIPAADDVVMCDSTGSLDATTLPMQMIENIYSNCFKT